MQSTSYQLPTSVIANAPGIAGWQDPQNLFLVDGQFAVSNGPANITTVGNFNLNIPQGSLITNFIVQVKGYIGSFNTTLQVYAVDDTTGVTLSYPLVPFTGFDGTNTLYTFAPSLFGTTWTIDQANNIKFQLIANGVLYLDAILVSAVYVPSATLTLNYNSLAGTFQAGEQVNDITSGASGTIVTDNGSDLMTVANVVGNFNPGDSISGATSHATALIDAAPSGQVVVDEFVEAQTFQLAQSMTATDIFMFLESFNYPDGTPIQYADFYGTEGCLVIDQGVPGKEEQTLIASVEQNYQGSGYCRIGFGTLANRGLKFSYPYTSQSQLIVSHFGTAQAVLSNDARFYNRFLKKAQIDALVSAPITVDNQGSPLYDVLHELDFVGAGVSVANAGGNTKKKIVTIAGAGINTPVVVSTSSSSSNGIAVPTLTWNHVSSGINRLLVVQVATQSGTVSGVTYNGVALTQGVVITSGTVTSEQWYLVAPPVGTYQIIVSVSPNAVLTAGAETYVSVNQAAPIGVIQSATGSSTSPSLVLTTGTTNSTVVDSLATAALPMVYTVGSGQTVNWDIFNNPNTVQGASSIQSAGTAPDAVTMAWAITQSTPWAQTAMEIQGLPATAVQQVGIQFDDQTGAPLGSAGTVNEFEITGSGVSAARSGNKVTYTITTGSTGVASLNTLTGAVVLAAGTNISITPSGNTLTIAATGSSGGGAWTKISTQTWTSQTITQNTLTSIAEWTGLTGDTDDEYLIIWELYSVAGSYYPSITFNNDTTTGDYASSPSGAITNCAVLDISSSSNYLLGETVIKASGTIAGAAKFLHTTVNQQSTTYSATVGSVTGGSWSGSSQITQIDLNIYTSSVGGTLVSGKATLYKVNR